MDDLPLHLQNPTPADLMRELRAVRQLVEHPLPMLLTARQAAALLGLSRSTFYSGCNALRLPQPVYVPLGPGRYIRRWKRKQVEGFVERLAPGRVPRRRTKKPPPTGRVLPE